MLGRNMAEVINECDVVVIGAGPGGGSAALEASRQGLSVMVLEADPDVGDSCTLRRMFVVRGSKKSKIRPSQER